MFRVSDVKSVIFAKILNINEQISFMDYKHHNAKLLIGITSPCKSISAVLNRKLYYYQRICSTNLYSFASFDVAACFTLWLHPLLASKFNTVLYDFVSSVHYVCLFAPEETHVDTGRACKVRTEKAQLFVAVVVGVSIQISIASIPTLVLIDPIR